MRYWLVVEVRRNEVFTILGVVNKRRRVTAIEAVRDRGSGKGEIEAFQITGMGSKSEPKRVIKWLTEMGMTDEEIRLTADYITDFLKKILYRRERER